MDTTTFVTNEPTCSLTTTGMPHTMKLGDYIVLQNKPCKIVHIAVCKTGKHGTAKYHFTGLDIFTQKKYEELFMCHQTILIPTVTRIPMRVLFIEDDGHVHLQNDKTLTVREDLSLPDDEDMKNKIQKGFDTNKEVTVIVQQSMNIEAIIDYKLN
jgi:translation initiation factor 5A